MLGAQAATEERLWAALVQAIEALPEREKMLTRFGSERDGVRAGG